MVGTMKSLKPLFLCLLFICLYQAHSAPWTRINPLYTNENLTKVVFNSRDTGLVISSVGELFYTHDGGKSWIKNDVCEDNKMTNICFVDSSTAFAFSDSGRVYRSFNGGTTWEWMFRGENRKFNSADYSNGKIHLYGGKVLFESPKADGIWRDVADVYNLTDDYIYSLYMASNDTGLCITSNKRAYTTDRGKTWTPMTYYPTRFGKYVFSKKDTNMCYKSYSKAQRFLRSNDYGHTWFTLSEPDSNYTDINYLLNYADSLHGWRFYTKVLSDSIYTTQKTYIKIFQATNDGGRTWTERTHPDPINKINSMFFIDSLYGWVVGNLGYIYRTTDSGHSWDTIRNRNNSYPYYYTPISAFFHNDSVGTVFTSISISRTYDKGNHWHQLFVDSAITIRSVDITDSNECVLSFTQNLPYKGATRLRIIRSTDSCHHFETMPSPLPSGSYTIFHKYNRGCLGPKGPYTSDGGKSWRYQPSSKNYYVLKFLTFDDSTYFWHTHDVMLRTTNPEIKWDTVGSGWTTGIISKLYDESHAQLLISRGNLQYQVAHTYDKAKTWVYGDTLKISGITPIYIQNENTFWGLGSDNKYIYKSKDGGRSWVRSLFIGHYTYTPKVVMHFVDDKHIWVFLDREGIFHTETGGE